MKTGILNSPTIAEESMTSSVMGMSQKGMDIAAYFLRDKIYSDKIGAVVREYICNALDEHNKYNIQQNVVVSLLHEDDQIFWTVRDFAKGLDDNGIRNIFGMYFESTKDKDNDSIGGFGIGSKAGLCYSDTFYVTSYHGGKKRLYVCTLGSGQKGVPVGEVYDISEEDTTETGIEIKIPVKASDSNAFNNSTKTLITYLCPSTQIEYENLIDTYDCNVIIPDTPTHRKELSDGIFINTYNQSQYRYQSHTHVSVRMGGIIYGDISVYTSSLTNKHHFHVVDVPIGSLTLPISRENFENTQSNLNYLDKVKKLISDFVTELQEKCPTVTVGQSLDEYFTKNPNTGNIYGFGRNLYDDGFFTYYYRDLYPKVCYFLNTIRLRNYSSVSKDANGKYKIYVIPHVKNPNNWYTRLNAHLANQNYIYISGNSLPADMSDEIFSDIEFVCVKSMKLPPLPKVPKDKTKYAIYYNGNCIGSMTPQELEDKVATKYAYKKDWHKTCDKTELNKRVISIRTNCYRKSGYFTNSQKFVDEMVKLGWIVFDSPEYKAALTRIADEEAEIAKKESALPKLRSQYFDTDFHPKLVESIIKNSDKLDRLVKAKNEILKEDSFRSRILNKIMSCDPYGYKNLRKISRQDLRRILKLQG